MGVEVCMNRSCKEGSTGEWKKGWPLRSGGFARLCSNCGSAYDNSVFCYQFHLQQSGWSECSYCNRPIHCGCIVSRSLFEYLDFGGIGCVTCVKASQLPLIWDTENPNASIRSIINNASDQHAEHIDSRLLVDCTDEGKLMQLCTIAEASESRHWPQAQRDGLDSCIGPNRQGDRRFSNLMKGSSHSSTFTTLENNRPTWETNSVHNSLSLSISLGTSSGYCVQPSASGIVEGRLEGKSSSPLHQGQRSHSILSKPSKNEIAVNHETNKGMISQERTARPPADGRGKNLLLSRYWPKITDRELEQLSGDLKSTIVPLFEKVLSASDAGRIGRLVLPKSCAEAYFPPISQSEGLPLQIQDVKGKEWTFQFRFWPNNNSRMYVLEGVTPCMQSLQLNAGDTVTFSRIDPGGKFVMGFRRASNSIDTQDPSTSAHSNGISTNETNYSSANKNLHSGCGYPDPDILESKKGNGEPYLNGHSEHLCLGTGTADGLQTEYCRMVNNDLLQGTISVSEKRTRNIGPKSKRLLIHNQDAMELTLTWEEAQDLLCPPPSVKPSIVTIEDQEFEEYDEPPVFGKRTIFNAQSSGFLCSASEEMSPKELENVLRTREDFKKRRTAEKIESIQEPKPSGLDALASAAVLDDDRVDPVESSAGVTTKHPRHRPGCTCIVCIQPPSGKGRHKSTCACLACLTVKRRLNTLTMRNKKKRQSKSEPDGTQEDQIHHRGETETNGASKDDTSLLEKEGSLNKGCLELDEPTAGQIDLNCHPNHEDMQVDITGPILTSHIETTNYPALECMNQNGNPDSELQFRSQS